MNAGSAAVDARAPGWACGPAAIDRTALRLQLTPVGAGGVADHARSLRRAWAERGWQSAVWQADRAGTRGATLVQRLNRALAESGSDAVELLLHYSGYGYDPRGLCGWLDTELAEARRQLGRRLRLVVMFHELFATGPPWRTAFWLAPWQADLAARLTRRADAVATNTAHHAAWIERAGARPVTVLPVFSNVGEPDATPRIASRTRRLVLFGAPSTRRRAWRGLARSAPARSHLDALGVRAVAEVGPGASVLLEAPPDGWRWQHLGVRSDAELSALLADSAFGLIEYPDVHLAKSSVFAAYAAHGCVVLNVGRCRRAADGLQPGRHYVALAEGEPAPIDGHEAIAAEARAWYAPHAIARQQAEFWRLLVAHAGCEVR